MSNKKDGGNGNENQDTNVAASTASTETSKETKDAAGQGSEKAKVIKMKASKKASKKSTPAAAAKKAAKKPASKKAATRKIAAKKTAKPAPKAATKAKKSDDVRTADNSNRDFTRIRFNGEDLPKGRAVLAVVKDYASKHKSVTLAKLQEVFPDDLQKNFGMIKELGAARKKSGSKKLRYFLREDDVMSIGGKKVVVCNQWSTNSFKEFAKVAKGLGYNLPASRK